VIRFSNTVDIARPPAGVFAYLADFERVPDWNWAITATRKVTPGEMTLGTRYHQTRAVPWPGVEEFEITGFEQDKRIELLGSVSVFRARLTYELSPVANGTRLTNTVELEPAKASAILSGLVTKRIQASVAENLEMLRSRLEAQNG